MVAVLIAIESTRGTLISATLAVGEKSCRKAVSLRELRAYIRSFSLGPLECVDNKRN